jgi:hypothetical protein
LVRIRVADSEVEAVLLGIRAMRRLRLMRYAHTARFMIKCAPSQFQCVTEVTQWPLERLIRLNSGALPSFAVISAH